MPRLRWKPFPTVAYAMGVGVMGTALASPLYPLYQSSWQLKTSELTQLFVLYMLGVLASLLFLGRLTTRYGFLPILRLGLIVMTAGVTLSALASGPAMFAVSRLLIGVASGMVSTAAAIGLVQVSGSTDTRRTSAIVTVLMTLGFALGPLVAGLIAQWLPWPLRTAYLPTIVMGVIAVYALFQVRLKPPAAPASGPSGWRQWLPSLALPPRAAWRPFAIGCMGAFSAFGMFSLYASLAPSFIALMLPWHGPVVSGLAIAVILLLSAAFQLMARPFRNKHLVVLAGFCLAACNLLLMSTLLTRSTVLFAASVLMTALGHGLAIVSGMVILNKVATAQTRPGILATYMVVGYLGTIVPILALGWLSDHLGLARGLQVFAVAMAVLSSSVAVLAMRTTELPQPPPEPSAP